MRYRATEAIEASAQEALDRFHLSQIPVPVEDLAKRLGLDVEMTSLGEDVSGILVIKKGHGTIGVNRIHSRVRQRFTIAHEIGHFLLHRAERELFIDKSYSAVFRDNRASSGEHRAEIQANQFAAALLMPRALVEDEIREVGFDLGDENALEELAMRFGVSSQAMAYRVANLGLF